jgi:hypothetical protein
MKVNILHIMKMEKLKKLQHILMVYVLAKILSIMKMEILYTEIILVIKNTKLLNLKKMIFL